MPRLAVACALIGVVAAQVAPPGGQPGQTFDDAPSDPAAVGYLESVVDGRLYSHELAGVARLSAAVRATFEVIVEDEKVQPTILDLEVACDYATGDTRMRLLAPPTAGQATIVEPVKAAAQNVFLFRPSRQARAWKVSFALDGDRVRLDYKPRLTPSPTLSEWSEWHGADGAPVRRKVSSVRPVGETLEPITQEIAPVYVERDGRLLLSELAPVETEGQFSYSFEYQRTDGVWVLRKLVQRNVGWRLTLDFTVAIEKKDARGG